MPVLFERKSIVTKNKSVAKSNSDTKPLRINELYENILQLLGEINTGFAVADAQEGKFLFVNDTFCRICMYSKSEIFNLPSIFSLVHENYTEQFKAQLNEAVEKNRIKQFNTTIISKNENKINIEIYARSVIKNRKKYLILIIKDISDQVNKELMQKLIRQALLESERRYRSSIEKVEDYAIFMLDDYGRVISWNAGAQRIMGYFENETILKNVKIFFPETNKNEIPSDILLKKAKKLGHAEAEVELLRKSGKRFWALVSITQLNKSNFSVIIRDLTKNKASEELLHEQELQLRSLAAHLQDAREAERLRISRELHDEFSQVLTVLRMDLTVLSRMISKSISDPVKRISLIEKISSISQLLETAIRATRRIITELRPAVLDELGLFTAIQWQAQEFENRTGIRCKIIKLEHNINLDKNTSTAVFRILQEGLTNVAKHSGAERVTISLTTGNDYLFLEIKDNGKGIDKDAVKAPTSTGLLGIRERVMALNGKFEVSSGNDSGTTLFVSIPINRNVANDRDFYSR